MANYSNNIYHAYNGSNTQDSLILLALKNETYSYSKDIEAPCELKGIFIGSTIANEQQLNAGESVCDAQTYNVENDNGSFFTSAGFGYKATQLSTAQPALVYQAILVNYVK